MRSASRRSLTERSLTLALSLSLIQIVSPYNNLTRSLSWITVQYSRIHSLADLERLKV